MYVLMVELKIMPQGHGSWEVQMSIQNENINKYVEEAKLQQTEQTIMCKLLRKS